MLQNIFINVCVITVSHIIHNSYILSTTRHYAYTRNKRIQYFYDTIIKSIFIETTITF